MLKHILFISVMLSSFFAFTQENEPKLNCNDFYTGSFQLTGKKSHILIQRTATTQTEVNTKTGDEFVYNIKWISDCAFVLTPTVEEEKEFFKNKTFMAEIIAINGKTYTCKAGFVGEKVSVTDEIRKIE